MSIENPYNRGYAEAQVRHLPIQYQQIVKTFLQQLPYPSNILEIGSGSGAMLNDISSWGYTHIFGIDRNISALRSASEDGCKIPTFAATIQSLPFDDGTFEAGISIHTLEHTIGKDTVLPDLIHNLGEVYRVTKEGGRGLHIYPNPWIFRQEGALVDAIRATGLDEVSAADVPQRLFRAWKLAGYLHPHRISKKIIMEALDRTKWEVVSLHSLYVSAEKGRSWVLEVKK